MLEFVMQALIDFIANSEFFELIEYTFSDIRFPFIYNKTKRFQKFEQY